MTAVYFADDSVRRDFDRLASSEFRDLHRHVTAAFKEIAANPVRAGIAIRKELIPALYRKKHGVTNLFKYDLPGGWRLLYSVKQDGVEVIAIILEWLTHKEYERRFGYRAR